MEEHLTVINRLMVDVFNDILRIEENAFRGTRYNDVSITETHTIEAVGLHDTPTMSELAKKLSITVGTLTTAINNLEKKGYAERLRSREDRRVVRVSLTDKGRVIYRIHAKFHQNMIKTAAAGLNHDEMKILSHALANLHDLLRNTEKTK